MTSKIVVGVDGSAHSDRALRWCAEHARAFDAEVVVVHAIALPAYGPAMAPYYADSVLTPGEITDLRDIIESDWCKPLADAGASFQIKTYVGAPAPAIMKVARTEEAALVVVGRRGRGGFAELLLGSTSHQLSHHLECPLVIVP
jgi:nucleotide-binding universal stress UspA family protein